MFDFESLFDIDKMTADGFTRRFAVYYKKKAEADYQKGYYALEKIQWAHERGFLADRIAAYNLSENNYQNYLSDYDFNKLWPLNNPYRIWINDKLTMKYILPDNLFGKFLPKYYFYSTSKGLMQLLDCDQSKYPGEIDGLLALLKMQKHLAMKKVNGSGSNNFYRLSFENGEFCINGQKKEKKEFAEFIISRPHYIITEYLVPHSQLSKIHNIIHTLRLMVINEKGNDPLLTHAYLRFGTNLHGEANYTNQAMECKANYNFVAQIDLDTGYYHNSKIVYPDRIIDTPEHPDTGTIVKGYLPYWSVIREGVLSISRYLFQCEFCGFDIGITEDGFKLMEINSHQGINFLQLFHSLYDIPWARDYFQRRLAEINALSSEEKARRAEILR